MNWENTATFNTYKEAKQYKDSFLTLAENALMQIKIKRYEREGREFFILKTRKDPELQKAEEALSNKKKGK
jgi:hypothetical protein